MNTHACFELVFPDDIRHIISDILDQGSDRATITMDLDGKRVVLEFHIQDVRPIEE